MQTRCTNIKSKGREDQTAMVEVHLLLEHSRVCHLEQPNLQPAHCPCIRVQLDSGFMCGSDFAPTSNLARMLAPKCALGAVPGK